MQFSFRAMWDNKCPRCREGNIFSSPTNIMKPLEMPDHCEYCDQKIEPEPGFYYGAMFISYIIGSWAALLPALILVFYFDWSPESAILITILQCALMFWKLLRGSRSLWLHFIVKYDPKMQEIAQAKRHEIESKNQVWKPRQNTEVS